MVGLVDRYGRLVMCTSMCDITCAIAERKVSISASDQGGERLLLL